MSLEIHQIAAVTFMVPWGLSQAATVRVGRALGARDRAGIARAGWTAWLLGVAFMTAAALLLYVFAGAISTPHAIESNFAHTVVRPLALAALGYLMAYWGGYEIAL